MTTKDDFKGKYLTDDLVSLPTDKDFNYNSLYEVDLSKTDVKSFYYVEEPPGGEEALGFATGDKIGSIFTIKVNPIGLKLDDLSVLTGKFDPQNISFSKSRCEVSPKDTNGLENNDRIYFDQLTGSGEVKEYILKKETNATSSNVESRLNQKYEALLNSTLMFVNAPRVPYYSVECLPKADIKTSTFNNMVNDGGVTYSPTVPEFAIGETGELLSSAAKVYSKKPSYYCTPYPKDAKVSYYEKRQVWYIEDFYRSNLELDKLSKEELEELERMEKEYAYYYVLHRYPYNPNSVSAADTVSKFSYELRDEVYDMVKGAQDMRICVSSNLEAMSMKKYLTSYPERFVNPTWTESLMADIGSLYNDMFDERRFAHTGFNLYGQDAFGRVISVVYIKKGGQWINLNKFIIVKLVEKGIASRPEMMEENVANEAFHPSDYNLAYSTYQDNFWTQVENQFRQETRRRKLQKDIFSKAGYFLKSDEDIYEYTVSIGDVSFFVPPTSIRTIVQTGTDRTPLLRAKGSAATSIEKTDMQIEMDVFFNNSAGINGYEYECDLWERLDGDTFKTSSEVKKAEAREAGREAAAGEGKTTYFMNGLRALVSEFKFTPFLPVVNKYINETLKVTAVALDTINISTVPKFPRLIKATIVLKNFDYSVFMPELPAPHYKRDNEGNITKEFVNPFALCFHYDLMRYYYQKPILRGNLLAKKLKDRNKTGAKNLYSVNSLQFLRDTTYENRTALMPYEMANPSPDITIYIPNENYLKRLLSVKMDAIRRTAAGVTDNFIPTGEQEQAIKGMASIYNAIRDIYTTTSDVAKGKEVSEKIKAALLELRNEGNSMVYDVQVVESIDVENEFDDSHTEYKFVFPCVKIYLKTDLSVENFNDIMAEALASYATATTGETVMASDSSITTSLDGLYKQNGNALIISCDKNRTKANIQTLNVLKWCARQGISLIDPNFSAQQLKEASDYDSIHSMIYDEIESVRVEGFQASMRNNFAELSTLESSGKAMQYLGSSDIYIDWTLTTKDPEVAQIFRTLPEYEAYCMRQYHLVLPSFPIRISSEFTRMLGVYEVSVETVNIDTVPEYPGLYRISVRTISTDRTIRNREALRSVADGTDESGVLKYSEGVTPTKRMTELNIRNERELNDKLARSEVYPDLELPTIGELAKNGFKFLRYKEKARDRNDLYVDPDFFVYYPHVIMSQIYRGIINSYLSKTLDNGEKGNSILTDLNGARVEVGITGVNWDTANKEALEQKEQQEYDLSKRESARQKLYGDREAMILDLLAKSGRNNGKWNISSKIATSFMESNYYMLNDISYKYKNIDKTTPDITNNSTSPVDKSKAEKIKKFYDEELKKIEESIEKLEKYLKETPIEFSNTEKLDGETDMETWKAKYGSTSVDTPLVFIKNNTKLLEGMCALNADTDKDSGNITSNIITAIVEAAYAACCAQNTYSPGNPDQSSASWKGRQTGFGYIKKSSLSGKEKFADSKTKAKDIIESALFNIKKIDADELTSYLCSDELSELNKYRAEHGFASGSDWLVLDPYYRYKPEKIDEYIAMCSINEKYAKLAYTRLIVWWLINLYKEQVYPSLMYDVLGYRASEATRRDARVEALIEKHKDNIEKDSVDEKSLASKVKSFKAESSIGTDAGKFFLACLMMLLDESPKNNKIYDWVKMRDYQALNDYVHNVISSDSDETRNETDLKVRKFILALVGLGAINSAGGIGTRDQNRSALDVITELNTEIAINACEDPEQYMPHSFYDMVRYDFRGRLLRAFPTYYTMFLDEGREIGIWKLHDNFYSINAIADITVVKSSRIAADTCRLVLNNNYSTFTTDDEDSVINYKSSTWGELWDGIVHKYRYAQKIDKKRMAAHRVNRAKLQPGIRIHVRMGYGSDARELGTCFNGVISQVEPNAKMITVVAQGFGIELMNPLIEDRDADEIQFKEMSGDGINNRSGGGATPRRILSSFLRTEAAESKYVKGEYSDDGDQDLYKDGETMVSEDSVFAFLNGLGAYAQQEFLQSNPYGIRNFGNPRFKDIFSMGEVVQNIYEADSYPNMEQFSSNINAYKSEVPLISFEPRNKTFWDVMHICQSVSPSFITAVADFGFRSTVFYGKGHYYYAYDYDYLYDNTVVEKRKPFQQYHIYTSMSDIMMNDIKASSEKIKTVATGLYKYKPGFDCQEVNRTVGPLYVDRNIFPEYLKSTIVDTRLGMKANYWWKFNDNKSRNTNIIGDKSVNLPVNIVQDVVSFLGYSTAGWVNYFYQKQVNPHDDQYKAAWTATANALKQSMKDMYQGGIIVIGDPSVKPQDRILLRDNYNYMEGQVLVRDIVQNLNFQSGFVTTINVDCISVVDDRDEFIKTSLGRDILFHSANIALVTSGAAMAYERGKLILESTKEAAAATKLVRKSSTVLQVLKEAINNTETGKKALEALKNTKTFGPQNKTALNSIGTIVRSIKAAPALLGPLLPFVKIAVAVGVFAVLAGKVMNFAAKDIVQNYKVLQIFPLFRYGMVYTAGLEGSKGCIYGSPSYNETGTFEKFCMKWILPKEDDMWLYKVWSAICFDEDVLNATQKLKRDSKLHSSVARPNSIKDEIVSRSDIESLPFGMPGTPQFPLSKLNQNSYTLSALKRVKPVAGDNESVMLAKLGYQRYYVENISEILNCTGRSSHIPIKEYAPLEQYTKGHPRILYVAHDELDPDKDTQCDKFTTYYMSKPIVIKTRVEQEPVYGNSKEAIDSSKASFNKPISTGANVGDDWNGYPYSSINGNVPAFTSEDLELAAKWQNNISNGKKQPGDYSVLSELDSLGRQHKAMGLISRATTGSNQNREMLTYDPPGWKGNNNSYSFIEHGSVYNRCHLLAYSLSRYQNESRNLVTGTYYMNVSGMGPFETAILNYVYAATGNTVLYRVTPYYVGDELMCRGMQLEARSLNDDGKSINFNVYCYNVQPYVEIDYSTGKNWPKSTAETEKSAGDDCPVGRVDTKMTKEVYDVPYLHEEALTILTDICKTMCSSLVLRKNDMVQDHQDLNGSKIIVTSALKVNSNYMAAGCGYSFSLQGAGKFDTETMYKIIQKLHEDIKSKISETSLKRKNSETDEEFTVTKYDVPAFDYRKSKDGKEIIITVLPRADVMKK